MASVLLVVVDPAGERATMRVVLMSTMADVVAALKARTGVLLLEHELRCGDGSALDPSTYVADQFSDTRRFGGGADGSAHDMIALLQENKLRKREVSISTYTP
jgi:hypothetical protein